MSYLKPLNHNKQQDGKNQLWTWGITYVIVQKRMMDFWIKDFDQSKISNSSFSPEPTA